MDDPFAALKKKKTFYLVHFFLQSECCLNSSQGSLPVVCCWLWNILEDNSSTPHVLILDEVAGVFAFLLRLFTEELGKSGKCHVITVKESRLKQKQNSLGTMHTKLP